MAPGLIFVRRVLCLAAGLIVLLVTTGCNDSDAQSAAALVRARPTTAPATYAQQLDDVVRGLDDALDRLSALLATPRYQDDAWKTDAVNQATLLEVAYRQLLSLSPPAEDAAEHSAAVQAVQGCQALTADVFQGVTNVDKRPVDVARARIEACRASLDVAMGVPGAQAPPDVLPTPQPEVRARVLRNANLRGGPGTTYPRVAVAATGDAFTVIGRTAKSDWLRVSGEKAQDAWIAAFLVEVDGELQAVPLAAEGREQ